MYTFFDVLICYTFLPSVARRCACDECALTASVRGVRVCARPINLLNMKSTICYPAETGSLFINIFQLIIYLPKVWFAPPTHTHMQFGHSYGLLMYELCIRGLTEAVSYSCDAAHTVV